MHVTWLDGYIHKTYPPSIVSIHTSQYMPGDCFGIVFVVGASHETRAVACSAPVGWWKIAIFFNGFFRRRFWFCFLVLRLSVLCRDFYIHQSVFPVHVYFLQCLSFPDTAFLKDCYSLKIPFSLLSEI